ncbi:MAG: AMP-binding protein, partial [Planctomycetaceae bacterium]|nr:AMP-binding protein [Planctomycetaceae bacterium]
MTSQHGSDSNAPKQIANVMNETRVFPPSSEFSQKASIGSMQAYESIYNHSIADTEKFWESQAREHLHWFEPFTQTLDWQEPFAKWFLGGKTNVSYNCLDAHVKAGRGDRVAFHWEGEPGDTRTITYAELTKEVSRFAAALTKLGIQKGDRVSIYMPMVPELPVAMLACARIGVIHSVIFGGFSAEAIADRNNDAQAKLVSTADGGWRRGKLLARIEWVFDHKPEQDIFWCTADCGWITGHSYIVYGPLSAGATQVLYEGAPNWPAEDRFWELIEKYKVTILYTAPTAIRAFIKWGDHHVEKHDLSSLRLLGSVGEGINPEAWMWYYNKIGGGRCPIVDTWWQTETGGIMMSPLPGAIPCKPGSCTKPLPGIIP